LETKRLFKVGNLYTGYPYGVEAELPFGSTELHGPFSTENAANTYMHDLIKTAPYMAAKVVRIETPQAGRRVVRKDDGGYEYAAG
jgi:hypothetical protein